MNAILRLLVLTLAIAACYATTIGSSSTFVVGLHTTNIQVSAIIPDPNCPPGEYAFKANTNTVNMTWNDLLVAQLPYSQSTAVGGRLFKSFLFSAPTITTLTCNIRVNVAAYPSASSADLTQLPSLFTYIQKLYLVGGAFVASTSTIKTGYNTGFSGYQVNAIYVSPECPVANYTLSAVQTGQYAFLNQAGVYAGQAQYNWQTTIGRDSYFDANFGFSVKPFNVSTVLSFSCLIAVRVKETGTGIGTRNLSDLQTLFDDVSVLQLATA